MLSTQTRLLENLEDIKLFWPLRRYFPVLLLCPNSALICFGCSYLPTDPPVSPSSMHVMQCWRSRGSLVVSIFMLMFCLKWLESVKVRVKPVLSIDVSTDEWPFYLLPLDEDIISLELPEFFRDNFLVNTELKWLVWCCMYLITNQMGFDRRGTSGGWGQPATLCTCFTLFTARSPRSTGLDDVPRCSTVSHLRFCFCWGFFSFSDLKDWTAVDSVFVSGTRWYMSRGSR